MPVHHSISLLDEILSEWREVIGKDYLGYRNHCARMLNFCFFLKNFNEEEKRTIIIASAHHDIGIWSDHTVDYLPPSLVQAQKYLERTGQSHLWPEVEALIDLHHKIRTVTNSRWPSVEVFRQADLVDFSLGVVTFGIPRNFIKEVQQAFPNEGFHKMLLQSAFGWFRAHPLSPPPFMKW